MVVLRVAHLRVNREAVVLPYRFPVLLLICRRRFCFSFRVVRGLHIFVITNGLSHGAGMIGGRSVIDGRPGSRRRVV